MTQGISGRVIRTGKLELIQDVRGDPDFLGAIRGITSEVCVPLFDQALVVGTLNVESSTGAELSEADLRVLVAPSDEANVAIVRARLYREMRDSEARFRQLSEAALEGIGITDAGRIVDANTRLAQMLGYEPSELVGMNALDFVAPESRELVLQRMRAQVEGSYEHVAVRKDGSTFPAEVQARTLPYQGRQLRVTAIRDITARHRAEQALRERERYLTLLNEIPRTGVSELDFAGMLPVFADRLAEIIGADNSYITIWDETERRTIPVAAYGFLREVYRNLPVKPEQPTLTEAVLRDGKPLAVEDMTVSPYASPAMASLLPMQSLLGLPLIVGNQKLGAALIGFNTRHVFTEPEIQRSAQAASQVALALSKARLFEATQRRAEEFATLYETSNVLSIQQDLNVLLHTIVQRAVALLNTGEGLIYLYDEKNQELEVAAAEQTGIPAGTRLPLSAGGASVEVVRTRQPIIVNDYRTWEHRRRELEAYSIASLVRVPILYAGELLGVLGVSEIGETTRKFNADDVRLLSLFAAQAAGAIHDRRLFAETRQRVAELEAVNLVSRALYRAQNMSEMLPILLDQTLAVMHTDAGAIWLSDLPPDTISRPIARGWFARQDGTRLKRGEGIAGHVVETGKVYFAKEFATDPRTCPSARAICPPGWGGACVPIRTGQETIGAMFVSAPNPRELNPNEAHLLTTLAEIAGNAIHRTRLNESLQDAYDTTLEGWARALELRDRETEGHTRRVTGMAIQLARAMGMNGEDLVQLRRGALLHDIGKMGIPDQILLKTGPLTRAQWKIMHQHPEYAHKMLANIPFLRSALDVPYCHHEKWDGSGYPRGLAGEAIPLAARIFAIVDVWDALLSDRPYRPAWTEADAKDYLRTQAGMHFDPQVVSAFFKVVIND